MPIFSRKPPHPFAGDHILITGGSAGLGLALARAFVRGNANVTLIGRSPDRLAAAAEDLRGLDCRRSGAVDPWVFTKAVDVTDGGKFAAALKAVEDELGPIDILVCNAGTSVPGRFLEQDPSTSRRTMELNYFGVEAAVRGVLPDMVARRAGKVVIIASAMAVCGFAGFSSYAPSKWAVRGLADCLRSELLGSGVSVHVAYPPDTDTPGYAAENATKPPECHAASRAAGDVLYSADAVAAKIVKGLARGAYHLPSPDAGQNLMVASCAGLSPRPLCLVLDVLLAPVLAIAMRIFGWVVDRAARRGAVEARAGSGGSGARRTDE